MSHWTPADQTRWNGELSDRFLAHFPVEVPTWRTIGREAEYPVVWPDGRAGDVPALLEALSTLPAYTPQFDDGMLVAVRAADHTFSTEVGLGTIELISDPCEDLHQLQGLHEAAMDTLFGVCADQGQLVLGLGMQPLAEASLEGMTPKPRYRVLYDTVGPGWLWFTLTASDQLHVDICRSELLPYTNLANALSAVNIALCANSPLRENQPIGACSGREAGMGEIGAEDCRHGVPGGPFASGAALVGQATRQPFVLQKPGGVPTPFDGSFLDYLAQHPELDGDQRWEAFLLHEHYIWHSARPRSAQATLELRSACQQPWSEHLAAAALNVGIVVAAPRLQAFVASCFGDQAWDVLRAYHDVAVREGLAGVEPVPGFVGDVLDLCTEALADRGRGEERFLEPLYGRLDRRENPAQALVKRWRADGLEGVLRSCRAGGAALD